MIVTVTCKPTWYLSLAFRHFPVHQQPVNGTGEDPAMSAFLVITRVQGIFQQLYNKPYVSQLV